MEPSPNFMEQKENGHVKTKPSIGDLAQWTSRGTKQWEQPKQINGFSEDGEYAFVEDSTTGIPVSQLSLEAVGERKVNKNMYADKTSKELQGIVRGQTRKKIHEATRDAVLDRLERKQIFTADTPDGAIVGMRIHGEDEKKREQEKYETESRIREVNHNLKRKGFSVQTPDVDIFANGGVEVTLEGDVEIDAPTQESLAVLGVTAGKSEKGKTVLTCTLEDASRDEISRKWLNITDILPFRKNEGGSTDLQKADKEKTKEKKTGRPNNDSVVATKLEQVRAKLGIPEQKEADKNDFFLRFAKNPESILANVSNSPVLRNTDDSIYTARQGATIVIDTLKEIYPDPETLADRLREMLVAFDQIKGNSKIKNPGKDDGGYESFAVNQIFARMLGNEKELFERKVGGLVKNEKPKEGVAIVSFAISPTIVMGDFLRAVSKLKA